LTPGQVYPVFIQFVYCQIERLLLGEIGGN
jgi:hypothetical protein